VERLAREVDTAVHDPKFGEHMKEQGLETFGSTPAAMLATMRSDSEKWSALIKATGITIPQ
jgi:tripartite-type tricarboxylate transporter receptor subunit TctC